MIGFYVQVETSAGYIMVDTIPFAYAEAGYKDMTKVVDENGKLTISKRQQDKIAALLKSKEFQARVAAKVDKMKFDDIFPKDADTQLIPFIPKHRHLATEFDFWKTRPSKVVSQITEVPYMKVDGYDEEIRMNDEAAKAISNRSKIAEGIVAMQSPLED